MRMSLRIMLTGCVAAVSFCSAAVAEDILAVSWVGDAYTIDSTTGNGTLLGATGFDSYNGLCRDDAGRYLTQVRNTDQLIEVDPTTGVGTVLVNLSMSLDLRGMTYGAGTLWGIHDIQGGADKLYQIDPDTGVVTFIGNTRHVFIQGLSYGPDGILYGWDIRAGLLTIDTTTGVSTVVGAAGTGDIQTIAFDSNGTLWGCQSDLYTIDITTGDWTLAFPGNGQYNSVRGMDFMGNGGPSDCLTLTVSTLSAGSSASWDVSGATPNAEVAIVYGHNPGSTLLNGFADYCSDFGIDGVNQNRVLCRRNADGAGDISCRKTLPNGISGVRVLSQASERNTCPENCMSNIDDQVVG